jgi:hypothetical protein
VVGAAGEGVAVCALEEVKFFSRFIFAAVRRDFSHSLLFSRYSIMAAEASMPCRSKESQRGAR